MFILTNIQVSKNVCSVFDTKDNTNEEINLEKAASLVKTKKARIYGLQRIKEQGSKDALPIPNMGIMVVISEAKKALASYFEEQGLSKEEARQKAGL